MTQKQAGIKYLPYAIVLLAALVCPMLAGYGQEVEEEEVVGLDPELVERFLTVSKKAPGSARLGNSSVSGTLLEPNSASGEISWGLACNLDLSVLRNYSGHVMVFGPGVRCTSNTQCAFVCSREEKACNVVFLPFVNGLSIDSEITIQGGGGVPGGSGQAGVTRTSSYQSNTATSNEIVSLLFSSEQMRNIFGISATVPTNRPLYMADIKIATENRENDTLRNSFRDLCNKAGIPPNMTEAILTPDLQSKIHISMQAQARLMIMVQQLFGAELKAELTPEDTQEKIDRQLLEKNRTLILYAYYVRYRGSIGLQLTNRLQAIPNIPLPLVVNLLKNRFPHKHPENWGVPFRDPLIEEIEKLISELDSAEIDDLNQQIIALLEKNSPDEKTRWIDALDLQQKLDNAQKMARDASGNYQSYFESMQEVALSAIAGVGLEVCKFTPLMSNTMTGVTLNPGGTQPKSSKPLPLSNQKHLFAGPSNNKN
jgi:hypothetical protein